MTLNSRVLFALAVLTVPTVAGAQKAPSSRVEPFDSVFRLIRSVPLKASAQEPVGEVRHVAVNGERVYVVDGSNANVKVFDLATGNLLRTMGRSGYGPGEMRRVAGIVVDPDGSITTIDNTRQVIVQLDSMGRLIVERRLQGQWNGITQIRVGGERRTILTGRVGVTTREGGIPVESAPRILHEADSTGILHSFYPVEWPPTPWQRSFSNFYSSSVGSTIAVCEFGTNLVRFRDWSTNREWTDTLVASWLKPIAWPENDRFGAGTKIEQMTAWVKLQTLMSRVLLGTAEWYVAVVQLHDAAGEPVWGHVVSKTHGGSRVATPPGPLKIQYVRGDTAYVLREDDSGDYVLEVRRVRVSW